MGGTRAGVQEGKSHTWQKPNAWRLLFRASSIEDPHLQPFTQATDPSSAFKRNLLEGTK